MGHVVRCVNLHRPDIRAVDNSAAGHRMRAADLRKRITRLLCNCQEVSDDLRVASNENEEMRSCSVSLSRRSNATYYASSDQERVAATDSAENLFGEANESKKSKRRFYEVD